MEEIASKVRQIISEKLSVDINEVVDSASFTNDLGADSLDTVELIMDFESQFGISISPELSENITTVGDAIQFVSDEVAKKEA